MEEEVTEDKPILMWALHWDDGSFDLYESRAEARSARMHYLKKPSVVRVQITVLKDRK